MPSGEIRFIHCEVCKELVDDCVCEECPICHTYGDPACTDKGHFNLEII